MKVIDLCSGLGGFSQAFLDGGHDIIRIDDNPQFKDVPFTIIADIRNIRGLDIGNVDVMLMSPPCNHFSLASVYLHWDNGIPKNKGTVKALRIVGWCLDAVDYLKPKYWILENPRGMLRKILGKPKVETYFGVWGSLQQKPTDLWGRFPNIIWPYLGQNYPKPNVGAGCGKKGKDTRGSDPSKRALIPYELSKALCLACEKEIGGVHANHNSLCSI